MGLTVYQPYEKVVTEQSNCRLGFDMVKANGTALASTDVSDIRLTLRCMTTGTVIRSNVSVIAGSGGGFTANRFYMEFSGADVAVYQKADGSTPAIQERKATFLITYTGGGKASHEVTFYVQDLTALS